MADTVRSKLGLVGKASRPQTDNLLRFGTMAGSTPQYRNPHRLRKSRPYLFRNLNCRLPANLRGMQLQQKLGIFRVSEEFDLLNPWTDLTRSSHFPNRRDCTVDQRRTDGTLLDGQHFVRVELVVSERKLGLCPDLQPRVVAVVPLRRGMDDEVSIQFNLGDAPQVLFQNRGFDLELVRVTGVLVVTASTLAEIRASRCDATGRSLKNLADTRASKATFLFQKRSLDGFAFEHKRQEDGFASAVLIGGQAREAVAAVHEFFDGESQKGLDDHM